MAIDIYCDECESEEVEPRGADPWSIDFKCHNCGYEWTEDMRHVNL